MSRAPRLLIAAVAATSVIAVPSVHAEGKPGDVHDPTLGRIAPADAAERLLRASRQPLVRPRSARRATTTRRAAGRARPRSR